MKKIKQYHGQKQKQFHNQGGFREVNQQAIFSPKRRGKIKGYMR